MRQNHRHKICSICSVLIVVMFSSAIVADEPFISLFDGKTLDGWVTLDDQPITKGWDVVDGTIHVKVEKERSGHIKTTRTFENFELEFEWRIAQGGNSGVKYPAKESDSDRGRACYGCEFQILDDKLHKNGRTPRKTAGALYDLYAPVADQKHLKPLGDFNHSKVVVDNGRIEHWLNGRKIVEATIGSNDWRARVKKSKVSSVKDFANGPGVILLQEHLSEAWFKNIRIKTLPKNHTRKVPPASATRGQSVLRQDAVTIGLIGDSTVAEQSGWGPAFAERFDSRAKIVNYAKNGATLQALSKKLDDLVGHKPDYVLIQFGHNDQKRYDTKVYSDHLRSYVQRIRKSGGKAVIVSSVTRRSFDAHGKIVSNLVKNEKYTYQGTLTDYADAAEAVAGELNLPFIDLHRASIAHHNKIGRDESMSYNFKEGDKTHFNKKGAEAITDLILEELKSVVPELAPYLKVAASAKQQAAGSIESESAGIRRVPGENADKLFDAVPNSGKSGRGLAALHDGDCVNRFSRVEREWTGPLGVHFSNTAFALSVGPFHASRLK